jgi:hypothetical protein
MNEVSIGLSIKKDPVQAAKEAVQQARTNLHKEKVDLGIVFASIDLSCVNLLKTINIYLEGTPVIGCSGAAIISNQGVFKHGLIIMLLSFSEDVYFNTACVKNIKTKTSFSAGEELGEKLLYGFHNIPRDISVIFSDGLIEEGSNLIYGLQEKLGRSFPLAGASASDNLTFKKTYLYFNQELISDAACGMLLGGKLKFGLGIKHGWKPLGKPHRVTKSTGNIVYEIDGVPAVNLYEEYLACDLATLRKELKRISVLYPIGINLAGEEEYILRNILSIEDGGFLVFQGNVPQDCPIRLMIGTKESCLSAVYQAVDEVKKTLIGYKNNFVFIFDSVSRYKLLGREANKELEIIKEEMGNDTPIIGLYTYGEQAPLKAINYQGRAHFHNQTITILAIGG